MRLLATYPLHRNLTLGLAWSPDGGRIASSAIGRTMTRNMSFMYGRPQPARLFIPATRSYHYLHWSSPDGVLFATAGWDATIQLWEWATGRLVASYQSPLMSLFAIAWSPDGARLALAGEGDHASDDPVTTVIVSAMTGQLHIQYRGHDECLWANDISWAPDGTRVVSVGLEDATFQIWDAQTGACLLRHEDPDYHEVSAVDWAPDGVHIAVLGGTGICVYEAATGQLALDLGERSVHTAKLAWSPDGQQIGVAAREDGLHIWHAVTGELLDAHTEFGMSAINGLNISRRCLPTNLVWAPDGTRVAVSSQDNTVRILAIEERQ